MPRPPSRTKLELLEYLRQKRRLAAAEIDMGEIRVAEIDLAIDRLENGAAPMVACADEHEPVEEHGAA